MRAMFALLLIVTPALAEPQPCVPSAGTGLTNCPGVPQDSRQVLTREQLHQWRVNRAPHVIPDKGPDQVNDRSVAPPLPVGK